MRSVRLFSPGWPCRDAARHRTRCATIPTTVRPPTITRPRGSKGTTTVSVAPRPAYGGITHLGASSRHEVCDRGRIIDSSLLRREQSKEVCSRARIIDSGLPRRDQSAEVCARARIIDSGLPRRDQSKEVCARGVTTARLRARFENGATWHVQQDGGDAGKSVIARRIVLARCMVANGAVILRIGDPLCPVRNRLTLCSDLDVLADVSRADFLDLMRAGWIAMGRSRDLYQATDRARSNLEA